MREVAVLSVTSRAESKIIQTADGGGNDRRSSVSRHLLAKIKSSSGRLPQFDMLML